MTKTYDRGRFYTTEDIGEQRSTTPEGFLVCHNVPIARTGMQLYLSSEVPLDDAGNGEVRVDRPNEEVFRLETIASFEGKAVTVEHPEDFVTPDNWQQLAIGTVQNVRQGEGLQDDLLIADLVITDAKAIEYVNNDLPEVSAGYEATYEQTEPGRGVQRDIVGNHVALVTRGRAGSRCSIQDRKPQMKKRNFWDRLMTAVRAKDEEAVKAELEEKKAEDAEGEQSGGDDTSARIARLEEAVSQLVASMSKSQDEDPEDKPEPEAKAEDEFGADPDDKKDEETADTVIEAESAESNPEAGGRLLSGDSLKKLSARGEILAPGSSFRTQDKAKEKAEAVSFMRETLVKAYATDSGKSAIEPILAGRDIKKLSVDSLASVFVGAAEIMRVQNNARNLGGHSVTKDFGRVSSVSDINARNREFWANRSAR